MTIKTLDEYEKHLLRFQAATPAFKQCAKELGALLFAEKTNDAKSLLNKFATNNCLVRWEQLALCDLATIEKEKLILNKGN